MGFYVDEFVASDGHKVPVVKKEQIVSVLGSRYDTTMARIWTEQFDFSQAENAIFFGCGDMTIVSELVRKLRGMVIVYEPNKEIFRMQKEEIGKIAGMRRNLLITSDRREAYVAIKDLLDDDFVESTMLLCHPGYQTVFGEEFQSFCDFCQRVCDDIGMMKGPLKRFYISMIRNQLINIRFFKDGLFLSRIKKVWNREIPLVLVSAGPSLKKNASRLRELKGKALIFAVDAAMPFLLGNDIVPDIMVSVESSKPWKYLEDERNFWIPAIVTSNSNRRFLHNHKSWRIWANDHDYANRMLAKVGIEEPEVKAYTGVATFALAAMLELGAKKVIFVGQDLAYAESGDSHVVQRQEKVETREEYLVDAYAGGKIQSRYDWCVFREYIEKQIANYPNRTFINATEGGALIKGTKNMPLEKVADSLPDKGYLQDAIFDTISAEKMDEKEYEIVYNEYRKSYEDIKQIRNMGYDKVFYEEDYRSIPIMNLIITVMKASDKGVRRERFLDALDFVEGEMIQLWKLET